MPPIKITGRLRTASNPQDFEEETPTKRGRTLIFSVLTFDRITEEIKALLGKRVWMFFGEANSHIEQAALPLPVIEAPKPEPKLITIKTQPKVKPAPKFDRRKKEWVIDYAWWGYCHICQKAAKGKIPDEYEAVDIRFYMAIPIDEPNSVKLQRDGKPHEDNPPLAKLVDSLLEAIIDNKEAISRITASKVWVNAPGYSEVIFS